MAISLLKDDNYQALFGVAGLRPDFAHAIEVTTGAAITETSIATLNIAANQNAQRQAFISVIAITNPCYFSVGPAGSAPADNTTRSEEHTSELQSRGHLVCRLLLEKKKIYRLTTT